MNKKQTAQWPKRMLLLGLVAFLILGFGCLEEKAFPSKSEQVSGSKNVDLDSDGTPNYYIYDFTPVTVGESGSSVRVQRQVSVSVQSPSDYTQTYKNLSDLDLILLDQTLDDFSKAKSQSDSECSQNIGLNNVVCSDVNTCTKLCSLASPKCKKIAPVYDEVIASSMISYTQTNEQIRTSVVDARQLIASFGDLGKEENKATFLNKMRTVITKISEINTNPLYTNPEIVLCTNSDFGADYIVEASKKLGKYDIGTPIYKYKISLIVKPTASAENMDISGIGLADKMSKIAIPQADGVTSPQAISSQDSGSSVVVTWSSTKVASGYVILYEFVSSQPPEVVIPMFKTPEVTVKKVNVAALGPTNFLITVVNGIVKNYFIALGFGFGLTLAVLIAFYNVFILLITIIGERAAGINVSFRRAFGRTTIKWKADVVAAVICLVGGFYASTVLAISPSTPPQLFQIADFLIKNDIGMVGAALSLLGIVMAYFAVENFIKITILEKAYGIAIRQEKDIVLAKAATISDRIKELEMLVEEYTKADFDVSKEYDMLASLKASKIPDVAGAANLSSKLKATVDDELAKVDNVIGALKEKKRIADDNWPKWKDAIQKMLDEQGEVYISSLVSIPASMRGWALNKYYKETGSESVALDRDALKKKKTTPEQFVHDMISRGLIRGAVVVKQDKVLIADFADGGGTVISALSLKLNAYLQSLAKNLGQHSPQSLVTIGDKIVMVMMKSRSTDSTIFVNKDKFKEAVEQWKAKIKIFD